MSHTTTITQVQKLVEDGDWKELGSIMAPRLEFGTAGIRGRMGPGFGRMNDLVIIQVGMQQLVEIFYYCFLGGPGTARVSPYPRTKLNRKGDAFTRDLTIQNERFP